jgi:hypothetical protein
MLRALLGVSAIAFSALFQGPTPISLEVRVFEAAEEVSPETRITLYRAGERTAPVAQIPPREGPLVIDVPPGIYDVQAMREQDGRVTNIRWAERLVVMPYPDEAGHHLEVVNFKNGYGALQVRAREAGVVPDVGVYVEGVRDKEAGVRHAGVGYALFVVPAGRYDVQSRMGNKPAWHQAIDVPLDRTRLWLVP